MKTIPKHDTFLADSIKPRQRNLGYMDGFRFGFGFFISGLVIVLVIGGLSWGVITLLHIG
jgi:hypothetical protein